MNFFTVDTFFNILNLQEDLDVNLMLLNLYIQDFIFYLLNNINYQVYLLNNVQHTILVYHLIHLEYLNTDLISILIYLYTFYLLNCTVLLMFYFIYFIIFRIIHLVVIYHIVLYKM